MSQADLLLNRLSANNAPAVYTTNPRIEGHIVIGADRFITVPEKLKRIAVQFDHEIETVTFDCPRYWDEHDMSEMVVYIIYMRPDGVIGSYICDEVAVNPINANTINFNWTIRQDVTVASGTLNFLVCVKKSDEEGNLTNHWNSEICSDMYISKGMEFSPETDPEYAEIYPDIYTRLVARLNLINKIEPLTFVDDGNGNVDIKGIGFPDNIADLYNSNALYNVGDFCVYLGVLHKCISNVTVPEEFDPSKWATTNLANELKECFISVDDGKTAVASAITDMKVPTDATNTFEQMATNIRLIKTGQGDALPSDVREGVTFTNKTGDLLTGTSNAEAVKQATITGLTNGGHSVNNNTPPAQILALINAATSAEAFKQATVDGLANTDLGITADTAPATLYDILQGIKIAKGNATVEDVRKGITFSNETAVNLVGTSNAEAFKQATITGLTHSGFGVTADTTPEQLLTILQEKFPEIFFIYNTGILADGVTLSEFTNVDSYLHAKCWAETTGTVSVSAKVMGCDLTNFRTMRVTVDVSKYVGYGTATIKYGIDDATTELDIGNGITFKGLVVELDISEKTGAHDLIFDMNSVNQSSEITSHARVGVDISKIEVF